MKLQLKRAESGFKAVVSLPNRDIEVDVTEDINAFIDVDVRLATEEKQDEINILTERLRRYYEIVRLVSADSGPRA